MGLKLNPKQESEIQRNINDQITKDKNKLVRRGG